MEIKLYRALPRQREVLPNNLYRRDGLETILYIPRPPTLGLNLLKPTIPTIIFQICRTHLCKHITSLAYP